MNERTPNRIEDGAVKLGEWLSGIIGSLISFLGVTAELVPHWVKKRLMIKWLGTGSSAVFAYYVWLIITPLVGFIMITSYAYDEVQGYYKIHLQSSKENPDPFFMMQKPGIENNILTFVALLIANAAVTSIILLWF